MQRVTITSTCYHTRYSAFSFSLAWFIKQIYKKAYINIFFLKKIDDNAW